MISADLSLKGNWDDMLFEKVTWTINLPNTHPKRNKSNDFSLNLIQLMVKLQILAEYIFGRKDRFQTFISSSFGLSKA